MSGMNITNSTMASKGQNINANNLGNNNLNANTVSLNASNMNISPGNMNETVPNWIRKGVRPSNKPTLIARNRANGLEVISEQAAPAPKFKLGPVPGMAGGRRHRRMRTRARRARATRATRATSRRITRKTK